MPLKQTASSACLSGFSRITPKHLQTPQYHRLILAWCALVVLYGKADLSFLTDPMPIES
jgi:hypothetical protein